MYYNMIFFKKLSPLKTGTISQAPIPPFFIHYPNETSRSANGKPIRSKRVK